MLNLQFVSAEADKRSESPIPLTTPLTRSASLSKKASLLKTSSVRVQVNHMGLWWNLPKNDTLILTPRHFNLLLLKMQATSQPKKLAPLRSQADRSNDSKDGEHTPKKSKKFLKSILSRRKSRKDEPLPSYFDDYWATRFLPPLDGTAISAYSYISVFIEVLCSQYKYRHCIEIALRLHECSWRWLVSARCLTHLPVSVRDAQINL